MRLLVLHRPAITPDDDEAIRSLAPVARPVTFRQQPPRRGELLPAAAGLGLARATAVRMVHRVARHTAGDRALAPMPAAARFAQDDLDVLRMAHLADGRVTVFVDAADFTGGQTNLRVTDVPR